MKQNHEKENNSPIWKSKKFRLFYTLIISLVMLLMIGSVVLNSAGYIDRNLTNIIVNICFAILGGGALLYLIMVYTTQYRMK